MDYAALDLKMKLEELGHQRQQPQQPATIIKVPETSQ